MGTIEAHRLAKLEAHELVGHQVGMARRGQLEDGRTSRAVAFDDIAASFEYRRKLGDDAGQRRRIFDREFNEARFEDVQAQCRVPVAHHIRYRLIGGNRFNFNRPHQVMAGSSQ